MDKCSKLPNHVLEDSDQDLQAVKQQAWRADLWMYLIFFMLIMGKRKNHKENEDLANAKKVLKEIEDLNSLDVLKKSK